MVFLILDQKYPSLDFRLFFHFFFSITYHLPYTTLLLIHIHRIMYIELWGIIWPVFSGSYTDPNSISEMEKRMKYKKSNIQTLLRIRKGRCLVFSFMLLVFSFVNWDWNVYIKNSVCIHQKFSIQLKWEWNRLFQISINNWGYKKSRN